MPSGTVLQAQDNNIPGIIDPDIWGDPIFCCCDMTRFRKGQKVNYTLVKCAGAISTTPQPGLQQGRILAWPPGQKGTILANNGAKILICQGNPLPVGSIIWYEQNDCAVNVTLRF